ncbi:MAG: flavodoxin domain-containing protein [Verrucomicrobiales bacterium]
MNKILVLFDSATGHTEKMAQLVAEGAKRISETEVRIKSVEEATTEDVLWCEGLAVGRLIGICLFKGFYRGVGPPGIEGEHLLFPYPRSITLVPTINPTRSSSLCHLLIAGRHHCQLRSRLCYQRHFWLAS